MLVGLVISVPIAAVDGVPARLHGAAWLWLALSGGGNVVGLIFSYQAYRRGNVTLVVPIVSSEGGVAALIAIFAGEALGTGTAVALVLAAAGVCVASIPARGGTGGQSSDHVWTVAFSLGAALVFGVSLYATGKAGALLPATWVVPAARVVGTAVITLPLALRGRLRITRRAAPLVLASGICEVLGFFSYTLGTRHGIAVTAVLGSQFAAISVIVAYFLFRERMSRLQWIGVGTIIVGVSLLSAFNA